MMFKRCNGMLWLVGSIVSASVLAGCTHRDAPPPTPVENDATPTYRSTTNSYELNTAPHYTQSGINGGQPANLPAIASPQRFSENTPLALAVYSAVRADAAIKTRYVSVYSRGGTIKLLGTIGKSDRPELLAIIGKQKGVTQIIDGLQIK